MIRNIEEKDIQIISELTTISRYNIDYHHSAINYDDGDNLKAIVLSSDKRMIDTFPNHRFPKSRKYYDIQWYDYSKMKNHQIVFLYRTDRNGNALRDTLSWLLNIPRQRGNDFWWLNTDTQYLTIDNLKKIFYLGIHINNTTLYYTI